AHRRRRTDRRSRRPLGRGDPQPGRRIEEGSEQDDSHGDARSARGRPRRTGAAPGEGTPRARDGPGVTSRLRLSNHEIMSSLEQHLDTVQPWHVACATLVGLLLVAAVVYRKQLRFIVKSLARNKVRSVLTGVATIVLVFIVTLIWSILWFLDLVTAEKAKDFKAIVTERWQLPSQMPISYANSLAEGAAARPGDIVPQDNMTWSFFGGTLDPAKRTRENILFFFCMEPRKLLTMMDGVDEMVESDLDQLKWAISEMEKDKRKVIIGTERLQMMNKRVGERVKVTGMNYQDIDLEVEITAESPPGRYGQSAVMNRDSLNDALDDFNRRAALAGKAKHPLSDKSLNLVWLKVPDTEMFRRLADQVESSSLY